MLSEVHIDIYNPPKVAMDMDGNALVVWHGYTSIDTSCNDFIALDQCAVSRYYEAGVGWLQPEVIPDASVAQSSARDSRLIMDQQGNALLYWYNYDGNWKDLVVQFNPVSGWGQRSETIVSYNDAKRSSHFISDNSGGARVVWEGYVGNSPKIFYSGFTWGSGWSAPVELGDGGLINALGYEDSKPRIALSSSGNIVVAWTKTISGDL